MIIVDELLETLPEFGSGDTPSIHTLIKNLNSLQGLFLAEEMKNSFDTVWWAEQLLEKSEHLINPEEGELYNDNMGND